MTSVRHLQKTNVPFRPEVRRRDFFVDSDPGIHRFVREFVDGSAPGQAVGKPILLLHGARVPGLASFDLPVRGGSFVWA